MSITNSNNANSSDNLASKLLIATVSNRLISNYAQDDEDGDEEEEDEDDDEDLLISTMKQFQQNNQKTTSSSSSSSSSSFTSASSLSPKNEPQLMPLNSNYNNYIRYTYFNSTDRQQESLKPDPQSLLVDIEYLSFNDSNQTNDSNSNCNNENDQRLSIDSSSSSASTNTSSSTILSNLLPIKPMQQQSSTNDSLLDNKFLPISINENLNEQEIEDEDLIHSSIKNEDFDLNNQRIEHLFTPDSLESVSSNCSSTASLSDDLDEPVNQTSPQQQQQLIENSKINETIDDLDDVNNSSLNRLEDEPEVEDVEHLTANTEYLEQKEFEQNEKQILEEAEEAVAASAEVLDDDESNTSDTSLILEKIRKINKLQEKINDINNKIKTIDMTGDTVNTNQTNSNYYSLNQALTFDENDQDIQSNEDNKNTAPSTEQETDGIRYYINPNYCDEEEEEEQDETEEQLDEEDYKLERHLRQQEKSKEITQNNTHFFQTNQNYYQNKYDVEDDDDEEKLNILKQQLIKNSNMNQSDFRSLNNQTRLGIRHQQQDDEYEENEEDENIDDFDDEDDDDDIGDFYRQAQPVILGKKFASTGFLFHRFGGYLAPIEEHDCEESLKSSRSSSSTSLLSQQNIDTQQNVSIKGSTSCFNLTDNSVTKSKPLIVECSIKPSINMEEEDTVSSLSPTNDLIDFKGEF